jgi:hypothetical protein
MITPTPTPTPQSPAAQLEQNLAAYRQLSEDLAVTISQIGVIQRQVDGLKSQLAQRKATTGRIAASAYRLERSTTLNAVLSAPSTEVVIERLLLLTGIGYLHEQDIAKLTLEAERYQAVQSTLEALRNQQRAQQQALVAQRLKIDQLKAIRR